MRSVLQHLEGHMFSNSCPWSCCINSWECTSFQAESNNIHLGIKLLHSVRVDLVAGIKEET